MLLSICIPTYNFGPFIGQTLDSILPQLTAGVEVIVLDGGSTDETEESVLERQKSFPRLRYEYQEVRGGIDRDIERIVDLARGEYCWLFSADDVMQPNAMSRVLELLKTPFDVYLCMHTLCDFELRATRPYPPLRGTTRAFDFSNSTEYQEYFRSVRTSEAFFSFMGTPIFKVSRWRATNPPDSFRGSCWIVAGHLLWGMREGMKLYYLAESLLMKRGENDSFAVHGVVNRYRITVENFQHVANTIFGGTSYEARRIRSVLQYDVGLVALLAAKLKTAETPQLEDIRILDRIVAAHYRDSSPVNWIRTRVYRYTPIWLLKCARSLYRYKARN